MPGWHMSIAGGGDRVIIEDRLVTSLRGAEGGTFVPSARGSSQVDCTSKASWHFQVVEKASNNGVIFIGVEVVGSMASKPMLLGQDWFYSTCVDEFPAFYYSSDGDLCRGNKIEGRTGITYGTGDKINIQLHDSSVTFTKNSDTVGNIPIVEGIARFGVQLHRPGDKILLLSEFIGEGAEEDIQRRVEREAAMEKRRRDEERRIEQARLQALEDERLALEEAAAARERAAAEEVREREAEAERALAEEADRARAAEAEARRRTAIEQERRRQRELRRAKEKEAEDARKAAAQEQIEKVARSRGGFEEVQDPDAPSEREIQAYVRGCLPLRLAAARQMGMNKLPGVTETANMQILLSPQQYHAVKEHLTNLKRRAKTAQSESVTPDAAR